ncbi:hypothetical protein Ancab_032456 [Ancistrocladus abbreviatus]
MGNQLLTGPFSMAFKLFITSIFLALIIFSHEIGFTDGRASKHLKENEKTKGSKQPIHLHQEAAGWANQQEFQQRSTVPGHSPGDGNHAPWQPDETRPTTLEHNPGAGH